MTDPSDSWPDRISAASIKLLQDYKQAWAVKLPSTIKMQSGIWHVVFIDLHRYALVEVYLPCLFSTLQAAWPPKEGKLLLLGCTTQAKSFVNVLHFITRRTVALDSDASLCLLGFILGPGSGTARGSAVSHSAPWYKGDWWQSCVRCSLNNKWKLVRKCRIQQLKFPL